MEFEYLQGKAFLSAAKCRPNQPLIQWGLGAVFLWVNWPEHEADHSPPYNAELNNEWSYASTFPICLHGLYGDTFARDFVVVLNTPFCNAYNTRSVRKDPEQFKHIFFSYFWAIGLCTLLSTLLQFLYIVSNFFFSVLEAFLECLFWNTA